MMWLKLPINHLFLSTWHPPLARTLSLAFSRNYGERWRKSSGKSNFVKYKQLCASNGIQKKTHQLYSYIGMVISRGKLLHCEILMAKRLELQVSRWASYALNVSAQTKPRRPSSPFNQYWSYQSQWSSDSTSWTARKRSCWAQLTQPPKVQHISWWWRWLGLKS